MKIRFLTFVATFFLFSVSYSQNLENKNNPDSLEAKESVVSIPKKEVLSTDYSLGEPQLGNLESASEQFKMAEKYLKGEGVIQDFLKAIELYKNAADKGDSLAQFKLGLLYFKKNKFSKKSLVDAYKYFSLAESNSNQKAKLYKEEVFNEMSTNEKDFVGEGGAFTTLEEKFNATKARAKGGDIKAQLDLAKMFIFGEGTQESYQQAFVWYQLAAEKGNSDAQFELGQLWEFTTSTIKFKDYNDLQEAYVWFNLSAAQGNEFAKAKREKVLLSLGDVQLDEAQRECNEKMVRYSK